MKYTTTIEQEVDNEFASISSHKKRTISYEQECSSREASIGIGVSIAGALIASWVEDKEFPEILSAILCSFLAKYKDLDLDNVVRQAREDHQKAQEFKENIEKEIAEGIMRAEQKETDR